jgi:hypothetical protein
MKSKTRGIVAISVFGLLAGCNSPVSPLPQAGTYKGIYDGQEITATLKQTSDSVVEINLPAPFQAIWTANVGDDSISLHRPSDTENLKPGSGSDITTFSETEGSGTDQLYWSANEVHWSQLGPDHQIIASLDLTRVLTDEIPALETPQAYTLAELMARAKQRNFKSVVEFQGLMVDKENTLNADLNLLPHGNITDALNILSGSTYTELKSIGDFVPFLLPSRWFRVFGQNDMLDSEKVAWNIMDLDGVQYVESYAYESARDNESLQAIAMERTTIQALRDIVRDQEKVGKVQIGTSKTLDSLLSKIDLSTSHLSALQTNEMGALAQASGFYNPQAITAVTLPQDPNTPSVGNPLSVDFNTTATLAVSRSLELTQLDDLVAWAKMNRDARYFDWMDTSGDPNGGIGFGLPAYIEAAQAETDEIVAQKEEKKSILLKTVQEILTDLQQNVDDYNNAIQAADTQEERVLRQTENLKIGSNFDMNELEAALQDQVNSQLAEIDAQYGYLLALSRFNRVLYQGDYAPTPVK